MKTTGTTALMLALNARVEELEAFAKEIEQYGVLLRDGGAAPHDLEDLSAALAQCVNIAKLTISNKDK